MLGGLNNNVYLSSRNLKGHEVITNSGLSTYKIMSANQLVFLESLIRRTRIKLK